jgi:hypothetical protein
MDAQALLNNYRAGKTTGGTTSPVVGAAPVVKDPQALLNQYRASKPAPTPEPSALGEFAKGLVSAPATLLARPIQAGAEILGASAEDVNKFTEKYTGGIVAPVPESFGDVKKDIGRGVQTVALGVGSPVAAGAAFGFGSSIEQGNDIMSTETLTNTLLGAGMGKALDIVGAPILNKAGKVIGTVTPKMLKELAAKGGNSVADFMAQHEIAGGALKPLTEKIAAGAKAIDKAAEIKPLFQGAKEKAQQGLQAAYPDAIPQMQEHYAKVNTGDFAKPTTIAKPSYAEATDIYNSAKAAGNDVTELATKEGIQYDKLIEDGQMNSKYMADKIRKGNGQTANEFLKPYLQGLDEVVPMTSLEEVRAKAIKSVMDDFKIADKEAEIAKINRRFDSTNQGSLQERYKDGFKVSDLSNEKISHANSVNFENPDKNANYHISNALRETLEAKVPTVTDPATGQTFNLKDFNKELQNRYQLADYLEALHGKTMPKSTAAKIGKTFTKIAGSAAGSTTGSLFGSFGGYQAGGFLYDAMGGMSNPIKEAFLSRMAKEQPAVYKAFQRAAQMPVPFKGTPSVIIPPAPTTYEPMAQQAMTTRTNKTGDIFTRNLKTGERSIFPSKRK